MVVNKKSLPGKNWGDFFMISWEVSMLVVGYGNFISGNGSAPGQAWSGEVSG
jgi:hypothetical protein